METMKKHLTEEQLVLQHYRDNTPAEQAEAKAHLAECEECAAEFRRIEAVLGAITESTMPVPAGSEEYGREVWGRITDKLPERKASTGLDWLFGRRWVLAGGLAAIIVLAFVAGRFSRPTPPLNPDDEIAGNQPHSSERERALLRAVGDHLERSQLVLVEIANADPKSAEFDVSTEQERARDLLAANRLYEQTARKSGDVGVAAVLDDLERVLVEVANAPDKVDAKYLGELQDQIDNQGLLFKVRVMNAAVKAKLKAPAQHGARDSRNKV